jgi:hypothetical protein
MVMDINSPSTQTQQGVNDMLMSAAKEPKTVHISRAYQLEMLEQSLRQNIIVMVNLNYIFFSPTASCIG